jgi:hypothetical protein
MNLFEVAHFVPEKSMYEQGLILRNSQNSPVTSGEGVPP